MRGLKPENRPCVGRYRVTRREVVRTEQPSPFCEGQLASSPKRFWASVIERRNRTALPPVLREVTMNFNSLQDVFFDDEATFAMGAAFDQAYRSLCACECGFDYR
jgi:hypothetical protein